MSRKGIPNKNKSFLLSRLQDMYGEDFHPIMKIAKNCVVLQDAVDTMIEKEPDEDISPEDIADSEAKIVSAIRAANNEWSRISEYTEPKLKAIEMDLGVTANLHEDLLDRLDGNITNNDD